MNKRKRILFIVSIIIIIMIIILGIVLDNKESKTTPKSDKIEEIIENKKTQLVFMTDKSNKEFDEITDILNEYKSIANINILTVDKNKYNEDYDIILKDLEIDPNLFQTPSLIYIKDGVMTGSIVNFGTTIALTTFLKDQGLITDIDIDKRNRLDSEKFNDLLNKKQYTIILLGENDDSFNTSKLYLNEIWKDQGIGYKFVLFEDEDSVLVKEKVNKELGKMSYPQVIVTYDKKIVGHTSISTKNDILTLYKDTKIIQ